MGFKKKKKFSLCDLCGSSDQEGAGVRSPFGNVIDRLVGVFSPKAQVRRLVTRNQYAAAKTNLGTGGWNPYDSKVNTVIANSIYQLRARARQLVRDMPAMATAVQRVEEYTVGNGITLQSRVKDETTGKLAKGINQKIEDAWNRWCDEADAGGRLHFYEIQQLACRQEVEAGEYVIIKRASKGEGRYLPFQLLIVEPDQVRGYYDAYQSAGAAAPQGPNGTGPLPGNQVYQGVEYDPRTGKAVAYYFEDPDRWTKTLRIPADQVIMGFRTLRPNQLRGVTPLASVILLAHQLRDYLEAEISSAQRAARWLAFVTSADPSASMAAFGALATPSDEAYHDEKYTMEMGNAIIDFLRTGEQVTIANHNRPGESFEPFVKFILRTFAAAAGVTYELVSGDYRDSVYTAARVARNDMLKGIKIRRGRLVRQLCERVRHEFMMWAVVTGKLDLPNYFADFTPWDRCIWMEPGMEQLDPLREGRAESDAVEDKLRSPQEVLQARGRDPEQVLDEWAEWQEMLDDRGLSQDGGEAQLKTNPDAVSGQGDNRSGKVRRIEDAKK